MRIISHCFALCETSTPTYGRSVGVYYNISVHMQSCTFWLNSVFLLYCNFVIVKIICSPGHVKITIINIIIIICCTQSSSWNGGGCAKLCKVSVHPELGQHRLRWMPLKCFNSFKFVALKRGEIPSDLPDSINSQSLTAKLLHNYPLFMILRI